MAVGNTVQAAVLPLQAGFRAGVARGKEDSWKSGFQSGFRGGVELGLRWARLRGEIRYTLYPAVT